MIIWYKMMHKFSYQHNIEHNMSKLRALCALIGKNLSGAYSYNYMLISSN